MKLLLGMPVRRVPRTRCNAGPALLIENVQAAMSVALACTLAACGAPWDADERGFRHAHPV